MTATHRLGVLSVDGVAELQQSLELVVPGEGDDLQDGAELTEDLIPTQKQTKTEINKQINNQSSCTGAARRPAAGPPGSPGRTGSPR